jgi:hypothetical protein
MVKSSFVRVVSAALDETPQNEIILRCVISPESLSLLRVDDYQREAMPLTALSSIMKALSEGETLPDVELGMRGQRFREVKDGEVELQDPIYIIDGYQRINAAMHMMATKPEVKLRIGATIHFGTTKEWERERFRILNTLHLKVSPSVLLRNMKDDSQVVKTLLSLCHDDKGFVLRDRVCWSQRMTKGQLVTGLNLLKVAGFLHSHKGPTRYTNMLPLVHALDKTVDVIGAQNMRSNLGTFFDLLDECWGIKTVQYREGAIYMRSTFLLVLAAVLSDHREFWIQDDEKKLFIEASLRRKIKLFPISDPRIIEMAGSAGKSRDYLYMMMRDHINSGKRTKRLSHRNEGQVRMDEAGEVD